MRSVQRVFLPATVTLILFAVIWLILLLVFGDLPLWGVWLAVLVSIFSGHWLAANVMNGRRSRRSEQGQSELLADRLIELVGDLELDADADEIKAITRTLPVIRDEPYDIIRLRRRIDQEKMLRQFSEALNFTINFDAMLWLIFTNCQDALDARDFFVYLSDNQTKQLYTTFYYEDGQRQTDQEGPRSVVSDRRVLQVIEIGQIFEHQDDEGRYWLTAPLIAGADTLGALQASHKEIDVCFDPDKHDVFNLLAFRAATSIENWQVNQALQLRAQQLETLNEVIHTINGELEVSSLLNLILEKAIELLKVEAGSFLLVDSDTGDLEFQAAQGPGSAGLIGTRLPSGKGIAGQVAQSNTPTIINDVENTSQWFSGVDDEIAFHTHSVLTVPLSHQRSVLGVLQVINRDNGLPFTESDQLLLMAFAGEAAVALANARLLQQTDEALQERVKELSLLQELDRDLNEELNIKHTLARTLGWMSRLYDATAAAVVLFNEDGTVLAQNTQGYREEIWDFDVLTRENWPGLIGKVAREGEPMLTGDVSQDPDYLAAADATRSQMTIPILQEDRTIGVISIESNQPAAFDEDTLGSACSIVNHITASIANSLLYHQVIAANRAKSTFVSVVAHELKTPLTSIRGFSDLMISGLTGDLSDRQNEFLQTITSNVNRMMRLIQDLTDVSRADTGQLNISMEPVAITNVVSDTITSIRSLAEEKEIQIHLDILSDPPPVMGDHERLVQVMTNLISNACKYSPEQSDIYVSLANGNGEIRCTVRDTGYGISPDDQKRLFSRFFRSEDPNIRRASGTGLGLSITRTLIELHGGEIGFESELGAGTTFWFTLPQIQER